MHDGWHDSPDSAKEETMVTDRQAKALVEGLRAIAKKNEEEREGKGEYWKGQSDGRADAYNLAAGWLEQIIHEEDE